MPHTPGCNLLKPSWPRLVYPTREVAGHKMVDLPGGFSVMGSKHYDDAEPHVVQLSPFSVALTAVTEGRFYEVTGRSGRQNAPASHPVTHVSWIDGVEYIERCNREYGTQIGYLTEAEWEYAARGPAVDVRQLMETKGMTPTQFLEWIHQEECLENFVTQLQVGTKIYNDFSGDEFKQLIYGKQPLWAYHVFGPVTGSLNQDEVWYSQKGTVPVSWGPPNGFGLFGVIGGVWEWCADLYKEGFYKENRDPKTDARENPINLTEGKRRVVRGGSWYDNDPVFLRAACRGSYVPDYRYYYVGFRVAAPAPQDSRAT
jgi:formylglycine-generating enzyme required for sulfatase activity